MQNDKIMLTEWKGSNKEDETAIKIYNINHRSFG